MFSGVCRSTSCATLYAGCPQSPGTMSNFDNFIRVFDKKNPKSVRKKETFFKVLLSFY